MGLVFSDLDLSESGVMDYRERYLGEGNGDLTRDSNGRLATNCNKVL